MSRLSCLARFLSRKLGQVDCCHCSCEISVNRMENELTITRLGWSLTCLGTGFMKTVPQFYISRVLMGFFEASMYPALAITLT